jgi:hypothetical protein
MRSAAPASRRIPLLVADGFMLAWDAFMRRTRQGPLLSQSVIETERSPDLAALRAALDRAAVKFPLLTARVRRHWATHLPYWELRPEAPRVGCPLGLWREEGLPETALMGSSVAADPRCLMQEIAASSPALAGVAFHVRMDVAAMKNGRWLVVLTWSHLLLDGKGAELLCAELAQLCAGIDGAEEIAPAPEQRRLPFLARFRLTRPAMDYQTELQRTGVPSLGGPKPRPGKVCHELTTFDADETAAIRERIEDTVGPLFPFAFFVATTARAHDAVFAARNRYPAAYGISVPSQTRKRGARGPIFHNHVAALFFHPRREQLGTLEIAAAAMKEQFARMVRGKIAESFNAALDLMMPLPPWLFLGIMRLQFKGELCTCFQSFTGQFAPEVTHFAGAKVCNAYHLPCLGAPPGTGLFFSEHGDRLNVTLAWREGVLTDGERQLMMGRLRADLLGPELTCGAKPDP